MKKLFLISTLFLSFIGYSQVTPIPQNPWQRAGNNLGSNTTKFGSLDNRSILLYTNGVLRLKFDSIGVSRSFTTATTPTLNGTSWFNTSGWNYNGASVFNGAGTFTGSFIASGTASVGSTFVATGASTLTGGITTTSVLGTSSVLTLGNSTSSITLNNKVRVGSATAPTATLDVTGTMSVSSTSTFQGMANFPSTIGASEIDGISNSITFSSKSANGILFFDYNSAGGETARTTSVGLAVKTGSNPAQSLEVNGNAVIGHLIGQSSAPTITSGTGLGTGSGTVVSLTRATDLSGIIGVVTGTVSLGTSAVLATVTFNVAYGAAPNVIIQPANLAAADLIIGTNIYPTSSTTTMNVNTNTVALTASTTYSWFYHILQ